MNVAFTRTSAPASEPVTATEAKLNCRVTNTAENNLFTDLIAAARDMAEQYLQRGLITQTWKLTLDDWADEIQLPMAAPLASVTSVKYYDTSGTQQTLATTVYEVDDQSEPGRIRLKPNQVWPALQGNKAMAVEVIYVVGGAANAVLPAIKQGIQVLIAELYKDRDATVDTTAAAGLLAPYRVWWQGPTC